MTKPDYIIQDQTRSGKGRQCQTRDSNTRLANATPDITRSIQCHEGLGSTRLHKARQHGATPDNTTPEQTRTDNTGKPSQGKLKHRKAMCHHTGAHWTPHENNISNEARHDMGMCTCASHHQTYQSSNPIREKPDLTRPDNSIQVSASRNAQARPNNVKHEHTGQCEYQTRHGITTPNIDGNI